MSINKGRVKGKLENRGRYMRDSGFFYDHYFLCFSTAFFNSIIFHLLDIYGYCAQHFCLYSTHRKYKELALSANTCFCWWAQQGLNLRPLPCEGSALPLSYAPLYVSVNSKCARLCQD